MELVLLEQARKDIEYWKKSGNLKIQKRITELIEDTLLHPFDGKGKPEPLKDEHNGGTGVGNSSLQLATPNFVS